MSRDTHPTPVAGQASPGRRPVVTVYAFSQTGQLRQALAALVEPLVDAGARLVWHEVRPARPYPFPWSLRRFIGVFPTATDPTAAVALDPVPPDPSDHPEDLVVVGFQVWYLMPSPPVRALLDAVDLRRRRVLGVVACRNMWCSAALEVRGRVQRGGGRYLGTVAAVDTAATPVTVVTTLRWMLTGRRRGFRHLPPAGLGARELPRLALLGQALGAAPGGTAPGWGDHRIGRVLREQGAAPVDPARALADLLGGRVLGRWGRLLRRRRVGVRRVLLALSVPALAVGIAVVLPSTALAARLAPHRVGAAVHRRVDPALFPEDPRPGPARWASPRDVPHPDTHDPVGGHG